MDKKMIEDLKSGCTVYGYEDAKKIRQLQKEHPDWVDIIDDMEKLQRILGVKLDGTKRMPYFGAILTDAGRDALENA